MMVTCGLVFYLFLLSARQDTCSSVQLGPINKNMDILDMVYLAFAEHSRSSQCVSTHTAPQYNTLPCSTENVELIDQVQV